MMIMWNLVERLFATIWMLRAPIALCALIFGGMAAINEVGSWHGHDIAPAAQKACTGDHAQQDVKEPSC
ncbi:MAG TPA: hypothetical protein VKP60_12600 [Magnetospirillaceae bacterium]|nr:hypothetical protein [Magnetospirillaceae bacterium]